MPASTLISLDEYLHTSYHPDCDWVDGEVMERNVGEGSHSNIQNFFLYFLTGKSKQW